MFENLSSRRLFLVEVLKAAAGGAGLSWLVWGCGKQAGGPNPAPKKAASTGLGNAGGIRLPGKPGDYDLAVAEAKDPAKATEAALAAFGGVEHFVKKGDNVVLSPNLGFARPPEVGATTHPAVIRKVVELCQQAGAATLTVMEHTLDQATVAFEVCGAKQAVQGTSARLVSLALEDLYREQTSFAALPWHKRMHLRQKLPKALLRADVLIFLPVAKDHEAATVSFSMKKGMGVTWLRQPYHKHLHECITELNQVLRPSLIVMDATRSLQTRGPKGPGEVTYPRQVVVGVDPVTVDAWSCRYLTVKGVKPTDVPHLVLGEKAGLGTLDPDKHARIKEVTA